MADSKPLGAASRYKCSSSLTVAALASGAYWALTSFRFKIDEQESRKTSDSMTTAVAARLLRRVSASSERRLLAVLFKESDAKQKKRTGITRKWFPARARQEMKKSHLSVSTWTNLPSVSETVRYCACCRTMRRA